MIGLRRDLADWSHREPVWCAVVLILAVLLFVAALGSVIGRELAGRDR